MKANDSESAGEAHDPVADFAQWIRHLHQQAGKPSYAQVVRRSRSRYPRATVREGTISEMINGKRLPRWETVEPVAWALGGEAAVKECRQRWINADTARTVAEAPEPTAPVLAPDPAPAPGPVLDPAPGPAPEPGPPPGAADARRDVLVVALLATTVLAALVGLSPVGGIVDRILPDDKNDSRREGRETPSTGTSPSPENDPESPDKAAPSASPSLLQPKTISLTAHTNRPTTTKDGLLTISLLHTGTVGGENSYAVITPWKSCRTEEEIDIGDSVVIEGPPGWLRLIMTDFPHAPDQDARDPDFDIPVNFQISSGHGTPPEGTHPCR
ncbi:hypothetical protein [Streptomyces sp. NPDC054784]